MTCEQYKDSLLKVEHDRKERESEDVIMVYHIEFKNPLASCTVIKSNQ